MLLRTRISPAGAMIMARPHQPASCVIKHRSQDCDANRLSLWFIAFLASPIFQCI